ncbi:MAG TPA: helix-turn-helix domain-containing protein [Vicinamibacteria bacterium]|jgi:DNA-binding NtrC family response regulator
MSDPSKDAAAPHPGLKQLLDDYERRLILAALERAGGNQRRAARLLGVLPTTLCEKMKRLGIRSAFPRPAPPETPADWERRP